MLFGINIQYGSSWIKIIDFYCCQEKYKEFPKTTFLQVNYGSEIPYEGSDEVFDLCQSKTYLQTEIDIKSTYHCETTIYFSFHLESKIIFR